MTNWIKVSERQPTEEGLYLVVYDILGHLIYETCEWTPNLHNVDEYDFDLSEHVEYPDANYLFVRFPDL